MELSRCSGAREGCGLGAGGESDTGVHNDGMAGESEEDGRGLVSGDVGKV